MKKIIFIACFCVFISKINSQVKLPKLISDGMILQRDTKLKIWGWASENEKISIEFLNYNYNTTANKNGEWVLELPKLKSGGPHKMTIKASNKITIKDILIGDVWVCSGQSNMEYELKTSSKLYKSDIENSENNFIRQFQVPRTYNFEAPQKDIEKGKWISANPETVLNFSAVAYFFAKKIYEKEQVPIGLISSNFGGTPAQAWISEKATKKFPHYYKEVQRLKNKEYVKQIEEANSKNLNNWVSISKSIDLGYKNSNEIWSSKNIDDSDWNSMKLPGFWADDKLGNTQGIVWFRKKIKLNNTPNKENIILNLGRISDADSVFINGEFIGSTAHKYAERNYKITKNILQKGENTIAIRISNYRYKGGFIKGTTPMELIVGEKKINLKKIWKYKQGAKMKQLEDPVHLTWKPTGLYNGMIYPLLNYSIKGVIWYQGEGNVYNAKEYNSLFSALIKSWREDFNQGPFPFLFVQLANYLKPDRKPSESNWAMLREAQLKTLKLPNTGMAVIIDTGEENDIHPKNKKDVGYRLAMEAERLANPSKKNSKSPVYQSMEIKKGKIILRFSSTDYKLKKKGKKALKHFAIAGEDKIFVWAKAKIKNNKIIVWNNKIKSPIAVRYAWANNPEGVNLFDENGNPISPFRTDNW